MNLNQCGKDTDRRPTMIRIEYQVPTANGSWNNRVIFADDFDEADSICNLCDKYGYPLVDVSNYIEEA